MCSNIYKTTMDLFSSITCTWPKRWTSRFLRDTRFDLAIQMLWICNILSSTYSITKQTLEKWGMNKIEWMSDLSKKEYVLGLFKNKNHSKYYEPGLVIIFIDFFWRLICQHESVSHPESEVWKESSEIILMHTNVCEHQTLLDPQESLSTPFARGEQILGVGVCWQSISMIFTANISSDFMHLELYYYDYY